MSMRKTQRTVHFAKPLFRLLERHVDAVNSERNPRPPLGYGKIIETLVEKGLEQVKFEKAVVDRSAAVVQGMKAVREANFWRASGPALLQFIKDSNLEGNLYSYLEARSQTMEASLLMQLATVHGHAPGFAYPEKESQHGEQEASP